VLLDVRQRFKDDGVHASLLSQKWLTGCTAPLLMVTVLVNAKQMALFLCWVRWYQILFSLAKI